MIDGVRSEQFLELCECEVEPQALWARTITWLGLAPAVALNKDDHMMILAPLCRSLSDPSPSSFVWIIAPLFLLELLVIMTTSNGNSGLIPVIDLSGPKNQVAKQLVDAATTYGFVYIKSLGKDIPIEAIDGIFGLVGLTTNLPTKLLTYPIVQTILLLSNRREAVMQNFNRCKHMIQKVTS